MSAAGLVDGLVAVVTGGAQGLGYGAARMLAAHGARVFLVDVDLDKARTSAIELPGDRGHTAIRCDVTDEAQCRAAIRRVSDDSGRLDVLVNNAGIQYHSEAEAMDETRWRRVFDVNIHGMMLMSREAGRVMLAQGSGSIINVGSIASIQAMPRRLAYTTTKTAVVGLTRGLAVEWAGRGVRVNAVGPGYHWTPLVEEYIRKGALDEERIRKRIPMGRFGTIDDVARAILFFASPLSGYVTGQLLMVDGGWTTFGAPEDASL